MSTRELAAATERIRGELAALVAEVDEIRGGALPSIVDGWRRHGE